MDPSDKKFWVLTKEQYHSLVDKRMKEVGDTLKRRWDRGEVKKGVCVLTDRDFIKEGIEEIRDHEAYSIIEEEKQRRGKIAEGFAP